MRSIALTVALLITSGCVTSPPRSRSPSPGSSTVSSTDTTPPAEPRPTSSAPTSAPAAASDFVERVTTEAGLTYTVRYPRRAVLGGPIPVTVTIANHSGQAVYITYSHPIRALRPSVWPNHSGKMPRTPLGERRLSHREETANVSGEISPRHPFSYTFDLTDYYQLTLVHEYDLHLETTLDAHITGPRPGQFQTQRRVFEVGGLLIDVRPPS